MNEAQIQDKIDEYDGIKTKRKTIRKVTVEIEVTQDNENIYFNLSNVPDEFFDFLEGYKIMSIGLE